MRAIPKYKKLPKVTPNIKRLLTLVLEDGPVSRTKRGWFSESRQPVTQQTIDAAYDRGFVKVACEVGKPLTVEFYELGELTAHGIKAIREERGHGSAKAA